MAAFSRSIKMGVCDWNSGTGIGVTESGGVQVSRSGAKCHTQRCSIPLPSPKIEKVGAIGMFRRFFQSRSGRDGAARLGKGPRERLARKSAQSAGQPVHSDATVNRPSEQLPRVPKRPENVFGRIGSVVGRTVRTIDAAAKVVVVRADARVVPRDVPPRLNRRLRLTARGERP